MISYPLIRVAYETAQAGPTVFPPACPTCGAAKTADTGAITMGVVVSRDPYREEQRPCVPWLRRAAYACGGGYVAKADLDKRFATWWGYCPRQGGRR
jgi:hypothetical protein